MGARGRRHQAVTGLGRPLCQGCIMLGDGMHLIPYVLVLASSGFIYIAVSDLMPQMQRRATVRESIPQFVLIALGVGIVLVLTHRFHLH